MRTFGKDVVGVSSFFSGSFPSIVYFVWWHVGKIVSTVSYMAKIKAKLTNILKRVLRNARGASAAGGGVAAVAV